VEKVVHIVSSSLADSQSSHFEPIVSSTFKSFQIMMRFISAAIFLAGVSPAVVAAFRSSFVGKSARSHSFLQRRVATSSSALCMKTIAVFGASGLTASECVYQALKNGDNVVGLTR